MSIILSFGTRTRTHNAVVWVLFCSNLHIFRTGGLTTSFCRITLVWWDRYWHLILCWVFCFVFGYLAVYFEWGNRNRFFDFCDDNSVQWHCFLFSYQVVHIAYTIPFCFGFLFLCVGNRFGYQIESWWFLFCVCAKLLRQCVVCILHPGGCYCIFFLFRLK